MGSVASAHSSQASTTRGCQESGTRGTIPVASTTASAGSVAPPRSTTASGVTATASSRQRRSLAGLSFTQAARRAVT